MTKLKQNGKGRKTFVLFFLVRIRRTIKPIRYLGQLEKAEMGRQQLKCYSTGIYMLNNIWQWQNQIQKSHFICVSHSIAEAMARLGGSNKCVRDFKTRCVCMAFSCANLNFDCAPRAWMAWEVRRNGIQERTSWVPAIK